VVRVVASWPEAEQRREMRSRAIAVVVRDIGRPVEVAVVVAAVAAAVAAAEVAAGIALVREQV